MFFGSKPFLSGSNFESQKRFNSIENLVNFLEIILNKSLDNLFIIKYLMSMNRADQKLEVLQYTGILTFHIRRENPSNSEVVISPIYNRIQVKFKI